MIKKGLTLIEVIIVLGIISILAFFTSFNVVRSRNSISLDSVVSTLVNDIKSQQLQTMSEISPRGIFFESNRYTLFRDTSYKARDTNNFPIDFDYDNQLVLINVNNNQIVFSSASGMIDNFDQNKNSLTLRNINSNEQKTIFFNKFGVVYDIK